MAGYQYGPSTAVEKPRCWGKGYDESTRECKGCGFQNSCKEEIIRVNVNRPQMVPTVPQPQPGYYQPPAPTYVPVQQPGYYQQPPVALPPMQMARPVQPAQPARPVTYQPTQPQPVAMTSAWALPSVPGGYGSMQDPLYYTIHAAPPPMRPQLQGEGFFDRVVKNAALSMMESFFASMFLAVRQMIWAPDPEPPRGQVVDVTPHPVR